jgi:hypothetical protein
MNQKKSGVNDFIRLRQNTLPLAAGIFITCFPVRD